MTIIESDSINQALVALNESGLGTLFVLDESQKVVGLLTDGDVRRALIAGEPLDKQVQEVMNREFVSLHVNTDNSLILEKISEKVKVIPLVDDENRLVDYASIHKIRRIAVASPLLNGNELAYVTDCIKSSWISSQGKYVRGFEKQFSEYHNGMAALAVSNGTVALHLALVALGIGEGDEVIVPDLTFAASVNAILYTGATPVLIDIEEDTWNIDTNKLQECLTSKTKAIMPVHLYGAPCDMDSIMAFAAKNNLFVVEDCAEALGSYYKGKPVGTFGDAATYSFFGNKTITTGEGGMLLFKDAKVAQKAMVLRDHGMSKDKRYWHEFVGYNYRLTNLQAAVGVAQFERLEQFVKAKRKIANTYIDTLAKFKFFSTPFDTQEYLNSYWLFTFLVKEDAPFGRDDLMEYLNEQGIETRPVFYPMHQMAPYQSYGSKEDLQVSARVSSRGISLPSSVNLTELELTHICKALTNFMNSILDESPSQM